MSGRRDRERGRRDRERIKNDAEAEQSAPEPKRMPSVCRFTLRVKRREMFIYPPKPSVRGLRGREVYTL